MINPQNPILYLSYDGMTDPLGESQVIPYLTGLASRGYSIHIVSCEKPMSFRINEERIRAKLPNGIKWHPVPFAPNPPILSTLFNLLRMETTAFTLHRLHQFSLVHCRSYLASLIGLKLKRKKGLKFIFDMRGYWADERVEGKLWNLANPIYRLIYQYFKKKELDFLLQADHTISLTERAKQDLHSRPLLKSIPISVIPCCVDQKHFSATAAHQQDIDLWRNRLALSPDDLVISYLGAIGTWYMLDEMMEFFLALLTVQPHAKFLFITHEPPGRIIQSAIRLKIPTDKICIQSARRYEVPALLLLSQLSIFFIRPGFSKIASSPTKMGEILSIGIPIICNSGIGDLDSIMQKHRLGALLTEINPKGYQSVISSLNQLLSLRPDDLSKTAGEYFSLNEGIQRYAEIYSACLNK